MDLTGFYRYNVGASWIANLVISGLTMAYYTHNYIVNGFFLNHLVTMWGPTYCSVFGPLTSPNHIEDSRVADPFHKPTHQITINMVKTIPKWVVHCCFAQIIGDYHKKLGESRS